MDALAPTSAAAPPAGLAGAAATTAAPPPFAPLTPAPSSGTSVAGPIAAGLLLAALAVATLLAARRRRRAPRLVEIVESASLGPKRSLVVARMGDELLLLGSSEGGIALLATRPAPAGAALPAAAPARFDALLAESGEDAELRRKLAAGQVGSVA